MNWLLVSIGVCETLLLLVFMLWLLEVQHRLDVNWKVLQGLLSEMNRQAKLLAEYQEDVNRWMKK